MTIYLELSPANQILCYGFSANFERAPTSTLVEIERENDGGFNPFWYFINGEFMEFPPL